MTLYEHHQGRPMSTVMHKFLILVGFTRLKLEENQLVPGWAEWLSITSEQAFDKNQLIVHYMSPVHHPIANNSTV